MKRTFVTSFTNRIPVITKDPVQANPLKGWNNAYHGTGLLRVAHPMDSQVNRGMPIEAYHQHTWPADLCLAEMGKTQKALREKGRD